MYIMRRLKVKGFGPRVDAVTRESLLEQLITFQRRFFFYEPVLEEGTEKLAEKLIWWDRFIVD